MATLISGDTQQKILAQVAPSWQDFMRRQMEDKRFLTILNTVVMDRTVLAPRPHQIFRCMALGIPDIRVVIIGQDPYINGEAHGLAFSSQSGITPSLREIFKEIARTEGKLRRKFSLEDWEAQGVFLINTNLTTRLKKSLAHDNIGWQWFTGEVLKHLSEKTTNPLIVLAWGAHARKTAKLNIKTVNIPHRRLLEHTHPAARFQEFTGNNHFAETNRLLVQWGETPIDWAGPDYSPVVQPDFENLNENGSKEVQDVPPAGDIHEDLPNEQGLPG